MQWSTQAQHAISWAKIHKPTLPSSGGCSIILLEWSSGVNSPWMQFAVGCDITYLSYCCMGSILSICAAVLAGWDLVRPLKVSLMSPLHRETHQVKKQFTLFRDGVSHFFMLCIPPAWRYEHFKGKHQIPKGVSELIILGQASVHTKCVHNMYRVWEHLHQHWKMISTCPKNCKSLFNADVSVPSPCTDIVHGFCMHKIWSGSFHSSHGWVISTFLSYSSLHNVNPLCFLQF